MTVSLRQLHKNPGQYSFTRFYVKCRKRGFLGSNGNVFQPTGHADQNCLIEAVLIHITGISD